MEESPPFTILEGNITGIKFGLATRQEICTSSNSDCPISHASQLSNPFLGLPLESGKCESCGTAEPGKCEGHFGYIELPIPVYHPSHVGELKRLLSLLCLKCLKMKNRKFQVKNIGVLERALSACCEEASQVSVIEGKTTDGACYLELKVPSRSRSLDDLWNFLERYGFRYGNDHCRPLLPCEAMVILKKIPEVTRKKLAGKGYFPQDGYIMQYLPVPPNCLSVPDISDGISVMSSDLSITMLKKVLKQVEIIKSSRSGTPNFQSHEVEANDLQIAVSQYLQVRGTAKSSRDISTRYSISKEPNDVSTKAWLEKMKTLFIRKGSGFSSRSVITGDPYKGVGEIGLPFEIAQRITFEERVNQHNVRYLQKLVDENLCLTYSDGSSTYSLREGSKGHTFLRPGQVVHRKIMDGDIVFINRPPTTHKHSLQALSVYVHEDHTVKINPLICGPLSADFDGDCVHLFYPQSLAAKAEVLELFSVEKQLLSSHSGNLNLELSTDSLLSLKIMFNNYFFSRPAAQQLALFLSNSLPEPAVLKAHKSVPFWTALQVLETCLPSSFDCCGERYVICNSKILKFDFNRDVMPSIINDIITSIFFAKGPDEVLKFFNSLQPMLMENLCSEGLSVSLEDFYIPKEIIENIQMNIQDISPLLYHLRSTYNELVELQLENHMKLVKMPITKFVLKSSSMGTLINSKSDSAIGKVVQQVGFLGLQLSDRGKIYSRALVREMASLFHMKYPFSSKYPSEEFGLVRSCLFHGLDPYQEMVHSISSREVMVRSSRGLTEPGTLFKNLMAILRDVVVCYDGTVRNVCSNSIIQFEYGVNIGSKPQSLFAAGEPVGVLAATAMSNPAYKAVLDSSANSNSSWEMMKEILLCGVKFKNDRFDRRVILYLNDCDCGRKYCRENAAYLVKNHLKKVSLKDAAVEFLIEYQRQQIDYESSEVDGGLVGHIHLNKMQLKDSNISMEEVLEKCQDTINSFCKKKKVGQRFKRTRLSFSECCSFRQSSDSKWFDMPCLKFFWQDTDHQHLEKTAHVFADSICPVLLETIIKGDPRVCSADIIWISPDTTTWIRNPLKSQKGELALDVVLEKEAVKKSGGAWRIVLDSCLPVIHLIDTMRSIPYAIKQVQDLLGISCAFEQAVQRLSTSVTMVAKGVLKEHLILLANSMTCSGNLIGFNMGGIKALSRTLNVQVPFTEATLFTPKKCFERAAEKCHMDSLSSIVASCSWGKHVAIGTGSPFDVLWDTREVGLNQPDGIDVYSFLHMVRGSSGEVNSACLGEEIDDLDMEAADIELGQSPEHSTFDKPTFEDSAEFDFDFENQNLGSDPSKSTGWDAMQSGTGTDQPGSWTSWGKKASATDENGWAEKAADTNETNNWGKKVVEANETGGWDKKATETPETSNWGKKAAEANETGGWDKKATETTKTSSWGKKGAEANETGGWNKKATETTETSNWGKKGAEANETGGWNKRATETTETSSWAKKGEEANETGGWDKKSTETTETSTWGKKAAEATGGGDKKATETTETSNWGKKAAEATGVWDKKATEATETSSWGKKAAEANETGGSSWGKKKAAETTETSCWGKSDSQPLVNQAGTRDWSKKEESSRSTSWVAAKSGKDLNQPESYSSWGKKADETGWSKKAEQVVDTDQNMGAGTTVPRASDLLREHSGWGVVESKKVNDQSGSWGKKVEETEETSWNKKDSQSGSWGSSKMVEEAKETRWNNKDSQSGSWGSTKKVEEGDGGGWKKKEGWGSSKAGEWKNKRNNPPANKPVGGSNDGSGPTGPFTATRQRFDSFTVEEQDILSEIEPVMQSIRRIMPGYKDGDPLSAEDQAYIIDNVFNYHPDKAVKMGVGIDYVMVNKHSSFQESRCFYIVSTDGRKEDFSYRKCLENFVRGKYPDQVELFMSKYFKKPQPRPGWNRERTGGPDEAATPRSGWNRSGWNREGSGAPEEGGTPRSGWNREAGTPRSGWNREGGSEGGTPRSGWNREGANEGGTPRSGGSGWNQDDNSALECGTPHLGWNQEGGSAPKEAGTTPGSGWKGEDTGKEKEKEKEESRW